MVRLSSATSSPNVNSRLSIIVDGSFKPTSGSASIAFLIINDEGMCFLRRAENVNVTSDFQAKVFAYLETICFAVQSSFTHITILKDCLLSIQCLINGKLVRFGLSHDIRILASYLSYCCIERVFRDKKQETRNLAVSLTIA